MSVKYHDQTIAGLTEFDTTPTQGSVKAVTSNGIATALAGKQNNLTFDATPTSGSSNPVTSNGINVALGSKVEKTDLTNIQATGTTNTTGATITAGKYFYLDGVLVRAKADIASGATFTLNTNYELVTAGVLNSLSISELNGDVQYKYMAAGSDFNDLTTTGIWSVDISSSASNRPINHSGYLIVSARSSSVMQEFLDQTNGYIYTRFKYSNSWTSWNLLIPASSYSSTVSFASMSSSIANTYALAALDNLVSDIANQNSGVVQLYAGQGPVYFASLGKYSNSYFSGLLFSYGNTETYRFSYSNGTRVLVRLS